MIYADTGRLKLGIMFTRSKYDKDKPTKTRTTTCTIVELLDGKVKELVVGETRCGRSDNFNKEEGRKKALCRAICQHVYNPITKRCKKCHGKFTSYLMLLNKAERLLVWQAYFAKAQAPKAPKKEDLLPNVVSNTTPPENTRGTMYAGAD